MIKTVITAPRGHMDGLIAEEAWKNKELKIVGCVGTPGRDYIGKDICHAVSGIKEETGVLVYDDIDDIIGECDVVIDFSTVELSMKVLKSCIRAG